ncbi:MAG: hypothetical protein LC808_38440, partial [Actinobacteria bacterium]|nr:hypothetical protein [Actinomycetota bacterium]
RRTSNGERRDISKPPKNCRPTAAQARPQLTPMYLSAPPLAAGREQEAEPFRQSLLSQFDSQRAWSNRADATSHALAVLLTRGNSGLSSGQVSTAIDLIIRHQTEMASGICWEGRVASTAYVLMNIAESLALQRESQLVASIPRAVRFILGRQDQVAGNWAIEDPPYGGSQEITEPYFTGVAARGVLAGLSVTTPDFVLQVGHALREQLGERHLAEEAARSTDRLALVTRERDAELSQVRTQLVGLQTQVRRRRWLLPMLAVLAVVGWADYVYRAARWLNIKPGVAAAVFLGVCTVLGALPTVSAWYRRWRRRDQPGEG